MTLTDAQLTRKRTRKALKRREVLANRRIGIATRKPVVAQWLQEKIVSHVAKEGVWYRRLLRWVRNVFKGNKIINHT